MNDHVSHVYVIKIDIISYFSFVAPEVRKFAHDQQQCMGYIKKYNKYFVLGWYVQQQEKRPTQSA